MAGRGPAPKPANIRQRTNRKAGAATITAPAHSDAPEIPNPDGRAWHPLTLKAWAEMWESEMASQWLPTDITGLGFLAVLYDNFYKNPHVDYIKEIRLQRPCYGLSPLDRSRLQWEVSRSDDAERKQQRQQTPSVRKTGTHDPRKILMAVK